MKKIILLFLSIIFANATTIERDTLINGLIILTVEAHKIPVVEMKISVHAGSVFDYQGKEGLANLVSQMLLRGTKGRSADEIVESIESVGGELSDFANEDYVGLNTKVLSRDLSRLIDLVSDCLQNPMFDSLQLRRVKNEVISQIKTEVDNPSDLSEREFRRLVFQNHPLGHLPEGLESSVAKISMSDIKKFYDNYYMPNNIFIVFVGDFQKDSLLALLNQKFGNWQRRELLEPEIESPIENGHTIGKIVKMDISQSYILLGHLGPKYGENDWYQSRVMNFILGGGGSTSRISGKIREEKGLAYDARSRFNRFNTGGYFFAGVQTKKDMTNEVVQILIGEMKRIKDTIDLAELNRAKKFYTGSFPLTYSTYHDMNNIVADIESQNLGLDYLSKFEKFIDAVTIEQAKAAAQKYLNPDRFCLVIVGDVKPSDIEITEIEWLK